MGWAAKRNEVAQDAKAGKLRKTRQTLNFDQPLPRRVLSLEERVAEEKKRFEELQAKRKRISVRKLADDEV